MGFRATSDASGFSMTELLLVVSVLTVMAGIAVPTTINVSEAVRLNGATREFERELQTTRLKAVQTNRTLRVRFACPAAGQYRRVEVMGTGIDTASNRCDEVSYPSPSVRDSDPATPAHDGPVRYMPNGLALASGLDGIEFHADGRAFQVNSGGAVDGIESSGVELTLYKGSHTAAVNVNGLGRIEIR